MRRMDELHLDFPFAGSRMLRDLLTAEGFQVGRRHVATLMKRMGIQAVYRKPNTSKPAPGQNLSVSAARSASYAPQPGVGHGHHLSAPRPGWSGVHMTGMLMRKEENEESPAPCCEGA